MEDVRCRLAEAAITFNIGANGKINLSQSHAKNKNDKNKRANRIAHTKGSADNAKYNKITRKE